MADGVGGDGKAREGLPEARRAEAVEASRGDVKEVCSAQLKLAKAQGELSGLLEFAEGRVKGQIPKNMIEAKTVTAATISELERASRRAEGLGRKNQAKTATEEKADTRIRRPLMVTLCGHEPTRTETTRHETKRHENKQHNNKQHNTTHTTTHHTNTKHRQTQHNTPTQDKTRQDKAIHDHRI